MPSFLREAQFSPTSISLCICTMNRPAELKRCLISIFQSFDLPNEIIISDDSPDGSPNRIILVAYPNVIYQEGPHQGLGSNRNACLRRATGSHIIFIDDDVCVSPDFFATARRLIVTVNSSTLITGYEINHSDGKVRKVIPHNANFLGFQQMPIKDTYKALVINATIFPRQLFESVQFDQRLRYGCDEIDVARHAISVGYQIIYHDSLYVNHYPSSINREHYQQFVHASRLYSTAKAYWQYERSPLKALIYLLIAPLHLAVGALRWGSLPAFLEAFRATALAYQYLLNR